MGSAEVLSAIYRHEHKTFWKSFVYRVCVVYIKGGAHRYNVGAYPHPFNGSSAIQHFELHNVVKVCYGIMFGFYQGLPRMLRMVILK